MTLINDAFKLRKDLLIEIFLRSSVESLLGAMCVCKQWSLIIKNREFIFSHLRYQKINNKGQLLLYYRKKDSFDCACALFDDETLVSDKCHDLAQLPTYLHVEGPVNGLYCLFNRHDHIVLWNPVLMEFKILPLSHTQFFPHGEIHGYDIGFGIDPVTHDYKVVFMIDTSYRFSDIKHKYVMVYNLTTDSWRLMYDQRDGFLYNLNFSTSNNTSFYSGTYYWWHKSGVLVTFNMRDESFQKILCPELSHIQTYSSGLTMYNDKIALVLSGDTSFDIWVMFEVGVWIKHFSVDSLPDSFRFHGLWKNDEVLYSDTNFSNNSQLILYNAITKETRNIGPGIGRCFQISIYFESLVSMGRETKHKEKGPSLDMVSEFLYYFYPGLY